MLEYLNHTPSLPTAFWADNDILAVAAIRALKELGHRVPEDVSIIRTDDSYIGLISSPALTTLYIPKIKLGEQAVQRIQEMIQHPDSMEQAVKTKISISLVRRESVSAPRAMT